MGPTTGSSECLDLYALAGGRSREVIRRFSDRWLTGFEAAATEYVFPADADLPVVYGSPWELIDRLVGEPAHPYALYWRNPRPGDVLHAMLFFTADGGLIAGLTVATWDRDRAGAALRQLAQSVDARYGYATWEEPPPDTALAFASEARRSDYWAPPLLP